MATPPLQSSALSVFCTSTEAGQPSRQGPEVQTSHPPYMQLLTLSTDDPSTMLTKYPGQMDIAMDFPLDHRQKDKCSSQQ